MRNKIITCSTDYYGLCSSHIAFGYLWHSICFFNFLSQLANISILFLWWRLKCLGTISSHSNFVPTMLISTLHFISERFLAKFFKEDSNQKTFKSITDAVFGCLGQIGDSCIVLKLLFKSMLNEMVCWHSSQAYSLHF